MNDSHTTIPIFDPRRENAVVADQLDAACRDVLSSGKFILGPHVQAFEQETARYLGCSQALGCNSGTDALVLALRALDIGAGDEVITTAFTFFATAEAITTVGATPVLVDICADTFNIDPQAVAAAITSRTKAILPVHLYGQAAAMKPLLDLAEKHGLAIVEDVAQAFGGRYQGRMLGTFGRIAAFSFFPSKNLGGCGDGGLVATDDEDLAAKVRMLRAHGCRKKYHNEVVAYNSRLDEMQAALLRVKLPLVSQWNEARRAVAGEYRRRLEGVFGIVLPVEHPDNDHVFHQFTIRIVGRERDVVQRDLAARGIETTVYYPTPIHRLPVYPQLAGKSFPHAEQAAREVLSLPMGPLVTSEEIVRVVDALRRCL